MEKGGHWKVYIKNKFVNKIMIVNNTIYAIGKDNIIYMHPIKEEKIEGFTNTLHKGLFNN